MIPQVLLCALLEPFPPALIVYTVADRGSSLAFNPRDTNNLEDLGTLALYQGRTSHHWNKRSAEIFIQNHVSSSATHLSPPQWTRPVVSKRSAI